MSADKDRLILLNETDCNINNFLDSDKKGVCRKFLPRVRLRLSPTAKKMSCAEVYAAKRS